MKIKLTEQQLWDFMYNQICKTSGISKFDLAISKDYKNMERRFDYFIKGLKKIKEIGGMK